jgi:membrane protease YdiL (CAAX protease family)
MVHGTAASWWQRVLGFPLTRLLLAAVVVLAALVAGDIFTRRFISPLVGAALALASLQGPPALARICFALAPLAAAVPPLIAMDLCYRLFVRGVEHRRPVELSGHGAVREAAWGALLGAALFATAVGVLALLGCYRVVGVHAWTAAAPAFAVSVGSGYSEELLMRAVFLRLLEEALGSRWALGISAVLFGLLHWANPHSTALSTASITCAGFLLGAAYLLTRRLWLAAGLHFAWNFTQGGIFGVAVSGHELAGLLDGRLSCAVALSGGAFGVEGSALAVALCFLAGMALLGWAARRGGLRPRPRKPGDPGRHPAG